MTDTEEAIKILDKIGRRTHGKVCIWKIPAHMIDGVQVTLWPGGFQIYGNSCEYLNGFEIFEELVRRFPSIAEKLAEPIDDRR
jgi:hypothetical protein